MNAPVILGPTDLAHPQASPTGEARPVKLCNAPVQLDNPRFSGTSSPRPGPSCPAERAHNRAEGPITTPCRWSGRPSRTGSQRRRCQPPPSTTNIDILHPLAFEADLSLGSVLIL
jgi:hypothetical protein